MEAYNDQLHIMTNHSTKHKSYQANDPRGVAFKMLRGTDRQMNGKPSYLGIKIELYKIKVFKACSKSIFKQFELIC